MCGIAGLFSVNGSIPQGEARSRLLYQMARLQAHRGPDDEGIWHDPAGRCSLAHRRLSIIDISAAGHQPMFDASGRWVISFNGELYNFGELRRELEAAGATFRTRTDTEVLLQAISVWGTEGLSRLDGMFAFAVFDQLSGELILARDPFGEKPLYYVELPDHGLAFASELQALEIVPGVDLEVSADSVAEVLMFQYIGAPRTIYRNVHKLPAGHWLKIRPGEKPQLGRYFAFKPGETGFDSRPLAQLADELEHLLTKSIERRLIADVPLGAFLSGGVDSSTTCALVRAKLRRPLLTFSIGFEDAQESEHEIARKFARHIGSEHRDEILNPDASAFLLSIGRFLDEPNADSSCLPTYLLSQFVRKYVTVAVSGDGGDELFGGYGRYLDSLSDLQRNPYAETSAGRSYYSNRILVFTEPHLAELFGEVPTGLASHLALLRSGIDTDKSPLVCRLRRSDVENYMPGAVLPKVDRMSMQHSLEVRTPFLNVELARFAERLPPEVLCRERKGKLLLREVAYRYLPKELVDAPKRGFALPMSARWGQDALIRVASQLLESDDSRLRESFGSGPIDRFMARQRSKNGFATYQVWALAMLESWLRHHPAKLPVLRTAPSSRRSTRAKRVALRGVAMGDGVFAVLPPSSTDKSIDDLRKRAYWIALGVGLAWTESSSVATAADWHEIPLSPEEISGDVKATIRGGALILLDQETVASLDAEVLEAWRAAAVGQVVLPHPHRMIGEAFVRLKFNQHKGWRSLMAWARLRSSAAASWWGFATRPAPEQGVVVFGPMTRVEGPQDSELGHRYAMFKGARQFPPLPVSHADIGRLGVERYSIWSRHCFFNDRERNPFRRYWVVECTHSTRRLLPMVAELIEASPEKLHDFFGSLREKILLQRSSRAPVPQRGSTIVVLTHSLQPGGAERQWCYLAIGLKEKGFNVRFVVQENLEGEKAHYRPLLEKHGIVPVELGRYPAEKVISVLGRDPQSRRLLQPAAGPFDSRLLELTACLLDLQPNTVYAQLDIVNLLAGVGSILTDVPRCILSFRNFNPTHFSYLRNDWYQRCYQALTGSPKIVLSGNSRAANEDYANWLGIAPSRVALVPNCIEPTDFSAVDDGQKRRVRSELGLHDGAPVILGVFRLSEEKDPVTFLRVCGAVARVNPQTKVLIAGVGRLQAELEELTRSLGLEANVMFLGRRTDVPVLMSCASLLLLTSTHEGMPNVVMEAQLLGVPVVATRAGGTADLVVDGVTGSLRNIGDVQGLAHACLFILGDPVLRQGMGEAGRRRMAHEFSRRAMTERYIALAAASDTAVSDEFAAPYANA